MTQTIEESSKTKKPKGDPVSRATAAYFKRCQEQLVFFQQPASYSGMRRYDGKDYVVLENINGPLAVYRVRADGRLEYLEENEWPGDLGKMPEDVLVAWALTQEEATDLGTPGDPTSAIVISREGANNPEPSLESFEGDLGPDHQNFDPEAADALLIENGYRRTSRWQRGMSPVQDRHGLGEGHACEVVKVNADADEVFA